jgi:TolB-like protein/cytochrome c-type biogenesis protein CcmH/NrfG
VDTPPRVPDYELLRLIGRGSYGEVWLARGVTGILRAIKVVRRDRFTEAHPFDREFKGVKEFASASGSEAAQLALLHVGRNDEEGYFYYVMELADDAVRGREIDPATYVPLTLAELRERRGRLPAGDCVDYGIGLARSLANLHRLGLVHRDIKPSNVILVGGVPKLADIGLVTQASDAGTFVGTEGFVPPEGPGTPSADVFALGRLLYELATGRDRQEFPQLPPDISRMRDRRTLLELNEVIMRACDPAFERRYRDGASFLADLEAIRAGSHRRRRILRAAAWPLGLAAVATLGLVAWRHLASRPAAASAPSAAAAGIKSVAVLPFDNLSKDPENAFFAEGVHEDVLTQLTLLRELHVVSGASVQRFRASTKSAIEIGAELGVAFVLRGSVERSGNRVHVTGQLIDAHNDENIWAKSFTRDLNDVFAIQAEIAAAIADAMHVAVSPEEKERIDRRPTANAAAYDLYLRARQMQLDVEIGSDDMPKLTGLLTEALRLDPNFAEAWGELGAAKAWIYFDGTDHVEERRTEATHAIDTAQSLAPDSPAVIRSVGVYYYYAFRDYRRAAAQFEKLVRLQPNDDEVYYFLGLIQRREGKWSDAVGNLQRACNLEPESIRNNQSLANLLDSLRRYQEAEARLHHLLEVHPALGEPKLHLAFLNFHERGSRRETDDALSKLPASEAQSTEAVDFRSNFAFATGDLAEAIRLDRLAAPKADHADRSDYSCDVLASLVLAADGQPGAARARVEPRLKELQAYLDRDPGDSLAWDIKGAMEAVMGNGAEAEKCVRKSLELLPESADALDGTTSHSYLAMVYAWTGKKDRAIDEIALLVRRPYCLESHSNIYEMEQSPWFAPLRGLPRFEAIVHDPANNAPLTNL